MNVTTAEPGLSVVVVTYGNPEEVKACLLALRAQTMAHELIIVDNTQGREVETLIAGEFPEARLIRDGGNDGYAGGNNRGLADATGRVVLVLNPDTVPSQDALAGMYQTLCRHPQSLVTAKLLGSDGQVNACGNQMHFSGLVTCQGLGDDPDRWHGDQEVFLASGAAVMAEKSTWDALHGFDASYFLYMEDADLSLRARLQGRGVWLAGDAEILHHYALNMTATKFYWLARNRWMTVLKVFDRQTLQQRLLGLFLTESLLLLYACSRGPKYVWALARAYTSVVRHRADLVKAHRSLQRHRTVSDEALERWLGHRLPYDQLVSQPALKWTLERMTVPLFRMVVKDGSRI